ncbi:hypothetical protein thsrh120_11310 [Rhizobium sp. No.120]
MKVGDRIAAHYTLAMNYIMPFFGYIAFDNPQHLSRRKTEECGKFSFPEIPWEATPKAAV